MVFYQVVFGARKPGSFPHKFWSCECHLVSVSPLSYHLINWPRHAFLLWYNKVVVRDCIICCITYHLIFSVLVWPIKNKANQPFTNQNWTKRSQELIFDYPAINQNWIKWTKTENIKSDKIKHEVTILLYPDCVTRSVYCVCLQEDVPWEWDQLFTEVTSDLTREWDSEDIFAEKTALPLVT